MLKNQLDDARKAHETADKRRKALEESSTSSRRRDTADDERKKLAGDLRTRDAELEDARKKLANETAEEKQVEANKSLLRSNEELYRVADEAEITTQGLGRDKKKLQEDLDAAIEKMEFEAKQRRAQEAQRKRVEGDLRAAKQQVEQLALQMSELGAAKAAKEGAMPCVRS